MPKSTKKNSAPKRSAADLGKFAVLILAAGKGTRLKSKHPKVLHAIGGKPLLAHVIAAAKAIAPAHTVVVVGYEAERVKDAVRGAGVEFILQADQRGTGHAVQIAANAISKFENVLVLSGDVPLIRVETLRQLAEFHLQNRAAMTILTARPNDPSGYGRIIRKSGANVAAIVEQRALKRGQEKIGEINSGIYCFRTATLLQHLKQLKTDNYHHEYYLTDVAALLVKAREKVLALEAASAEEVLGVDRKSVV